MSEEHSSNIESPSANTTTPGGAQAPDPQRNAFDIGVVISQAQQVLTDPRAFYGNMQKSGGYSQPLIFVIVMSVISGALFGLLSIIGLTDAGPAGLGAIIGLPIALAIGSFIASAVLYVIWALMGSPHGYETAYRCLAYSTAILPVVTVISTIAYLGTIVRVIWMTWLMIVASRVVHERSEKSTRMVFGILGALMLLSGIGSEYGQRKLQEALKDQAAVFEDRARAIEKGAQSLENIGLNEDGELDPEKLGRAMGDFARAFEEAAKGASEAQDNAESK